MLFFHCLPQKIKDCPLFWYTKCICFFAVNIYASVVCNMNWKNLGVPLKLVEKRNDEAIFLLKRWLLNGQLFMPFFFC